MYVKNDVKEPRRATTGSIGYDFYAPFDIELKPGEWHQFGTGVRFTDEDVIPGGGKWAMILAPRSGLGFKHGTRLRNTIGVIDCDYRDEIGVSMTADEEVTIPKGKAYMQGIVIPVTSLVNEIIPVNIRDGGFGSTDRKRYNE